jgi:hypothetical protein
MFFETWIGFFSLVVQFLFTPVSTNFGTQAAEQAVSGGLSHYGGAGKCEEELETYSKLEGLERRKCNDEGPECACSNRVMVGVAKKAA